MLLFTCESEIVWNDFFQVRQNLVGELDVSSVFHSFDPFIDFTHTFVSKYVIVIVNIFILSLCCLFARLASVNLQLCLIMDLTISTRW